MKLQKKRIEAKSHSASERKRHDGPVRIGLYADDFSISAMEDGRTRQLTNQRKLNQGIGKLDYSVFVNDQGYFSIRDRDGNTLLENNSRHRGGKHLELNYELTHHQIIGNLMVLSFGYDHVGIDLSRLSDSDGGRSQLNSEEDLLVGEFQNRDEAILWRFNSFEPFKSQSRRLSRIVRESNALGLVVDQKVDSDGNPIGLTGQLTVDGLCLLNKNSLICLDPFNGTVNWKRTDIPEKSLIAGGPEFVHVISPDGKDYSTFRVLDGSKVAQTRLPIELINRIAQMGPILVGLSELEDRLFIRGFQLRPQEVQNRWEHQVAKGTKAYRVSPLELAILEPNGRFRVIQISNGQVKIDRKLNVGIRVTTLQVFRKGESYLIFANRNSQTQIESRRSDLIEKSKQQVNVWGELYCVNQQGETWQCPVKLDRYDFVIHQAPNSPLLLFKKEDKQNRKTEFLFIRESDGSSVEFHGPIDKIGSTSRVQFRSLQNQVLFNFGYQWFKVDIADKPRPLEPPAQTGEFSSRIDAKGNAFADQAKKVIRDLFLEENQDLFDEKPDIAEKWIEVENSKKTTSPQSEKNKGIKRREFNHCQHDQFVISVIAKFGI